MESPTANQSEFAPVNEERVFEFPTTYAKIKEVYKSLTSKLRPNMTQ